MKRWSSALLLCSACGARTELAGVLVEDAAAVVDAADAGDASDACPHVDAGTFACGDAAVCNSATEYCHETAGGPPPGVDILKCLPLPNGCSGCAGLQTKVCFCEDNGGQILVSCPVP